MSDAYPTEWRDIAGFPGYRIGSDGSVWSCVKPGPRKAFYPTYRRRVVQALGGGHLMVILGRGPGKRSAPRLVHRLVLEAFVGPCPDGMECCHGNGIPSDNRVENLRWDTPAANAADASRHGVLPRGEGHWKNKLSAEDVRRVRRLFAAGGRSMTDIGRELGITQIHVKRIVTGRAWAWLP